jgi:hypothetical protein
VLNPDLPTLTTWSYGCLCSLPHLIQRSTDLYNKAPFWCHFIWTYLFELQISRVWKSQALSLMFWILDSCNVLVSDRIYIIQRHVNKSFITLLLKIIYKYTDISTIYKLIYKIYKHPNKVIKMPNYRCLVRMHCSCHLELNDMTSHRYILNIIWNLTNEILKCVISLNA